MYSLSCIFNLRGNYDGVSKQVNSIPFKSSIAMGQGAETQWAVHMHIQLEERNKSVLQFSLEESYSAALNNAVTAAVNGGLMVIVAANSPNVR